jgi:octanoyl-[GcvH]:protein N-octanoyltransferase
VHFDSGRRTYVPQLLRAGAVAVTTSGLQSERPRALVDQGLTLGNARQDVALGPVLLRHGLGDAAEILRIYVPDPTAAFSRRDSLQPGFRGAVRAAEEAGFTPVLRGPGGRLAAYHRGSIVVDHVMRLPNAPAGIIERFELYSRLHAQVLARFGLDARVGELEGEYCPGSHTVNAAGVAKIVGSAQRITRDGWLFSSVIQVSGSPAIREVLRETHRALGYRLELSTVGAVEDFVPEVTTEAVTEAIRRAYGAGEADVWVTRLPRTVLAEARKAAELLRVELETA